ncbi:hypothetical protein JMJ35_009183 [Cladonia borealis]|uniref:Uncharacterized protein n=1 Tax=Cladonia borealis TaxID=184061 RepID=A0AA39QUD7_9LECA|nr:hypothetical protein JMJ35_009183 [Cladonia borealis]
MRLLFILILLAILTFSPQCHPAIRTQCLLRRQIIRITLLYKLTLSISHGKQGRITSNLQKLILKFYKNLIYSDFDVVEVEWKALPPPPKRLPAEPQPLAVDIHGDDPIGLDKAKNTKTALPGTTAAPLEIKVDNEQKAAASDDAFKTPQLHHNGMAPSEDTKLEVESWTSRNHGIPEAHLDASVSADYAVRIVETIQEPPLRIEASVDRATTFIRTGDEAFRCGRHVQAIHAYQDEGGNYIARAVGATILITAMSLQPLKITTITVTATPATSPQTPIIPTITVVAAPGPSPTNPKALKCLRRSRLGCENAAVTGEDLVHEPAVLHDPRHEALPAVTSVDLLLEPPNATRTRLTIVEPICVPRTIDVNLMWTLVIEKKIDSFSVIRKHFPDTTKKTAVPHATHHETLPTTDMLRLRLESIFSITQSIDSVSAMYKLTNASSSTADSDYANLQRTARNCGAAICSIHNAHTDEDVSQSSRHQELLKRMELRPTRTDHSIMRNLESMGLLDNEPILRKELDSMLSGTGKFHLALLSDGNHSGMERFIIQEANKRVDVITQVDVRNPDIRSQPGVQFDSRESQPVEFNCPQDVMSSAKVRQRSEMDKLRISIRM